MRRLRRKRHHPDDEYKRTSNNWVLGVSCCRTFHAPAAFAAAAENAVPSAFAAYGHYLGLLLIVGSLATEKAILKPNISGDELMKLVIADLHGDDGRARFVHGVFTRDAIRKRVGVYSHEPIFWFKMFLFAVMGSSSLLSDDKGDNDVRGEAKEHGRKRDVH